VSSRDEAARAFPVLARAALGCLEERGFRLAKHNGLLRWASTTVSFEIWVDPREQSLATELGRSRGRDPGFLLEEVAKLVGFDLRIGIGATASIPVLERALGRVAALLSGPAAVAIAGEDAFFARLRKQRNRAHDESMDRPIRRDVEEAWRAGELARVADLLAALERPTASEVAKLRYALARLARE